VNFTSLKSRMIVSMVSLVVISLVVITLILEHWARSELANQIKENATNLLSATRNHVESEYNRILQFKNALTQRRQIEIRDNVLIVYSIISNTYERVKAGVVSESLAKSNLIYKINKLRFSDGVGYFWINDTGQPIPKMIMHPTIPDLDGTLLDKEEFYCALGKGENLFKAFVDVCSRNGEGFVDYFWPKPTPDGLSKLTPKLSFVKSFEPWGWIVGTGVYIDDIDKNVENQIKIIIDDLNKVIGKQKVGKSGYFFIFDNKNNMLVHPTLAGKPADSINIDTNNYLSNDLVNAYNSGRKTLDYKWTKPGQGSRLFEKRAYITYFEPLGWYIASSVYKDELEDSLAKLSFNFFGFSALLIAIAFYLSLLISRSVTRPLKELVESINKLDEQGLPEDHLPEEGSDEVVQLSQTINSMVTSIRDSKINLNRLRNYLTNIIDSMPSILAGVNRQGEINLWNHEAEKQTGISSSEARGRILWKLIPRLAWIKTKIPEAIKTKEVLLESRLPHKTNSHLQYEDITIYPLTEDFVEGVVIRVDDVTKKVQIEELMVQNEKMLSIGGLAAGMAHEINNPLGGMIQTAAVMKGRLSNPDIHANIEAADEAGISFDTLMQYMKSRGILRMLDNIRESGSRAAKIVQNMLSFARKSDSSKSSCSLAELLDRCLELAASDYDLKKRYDCKQIEIIRNYDENLDDVICERSKIQQVILNILRNGAEAMQEAKIDKPCFKLRIFNNQERDMVCMEIEDNGPGMEEETRKRVFEPFFTTKATDRGTGLGLSVSYFIITENHKGKMQVLSELGNGATFRICLPSEVK
jgi:two-component system NtrC family sensor kinase